jgi:outer membrane receptor protein involved in Fe transport
MKLDFRQRLLTTSLLVGASMIASPAFAQNPTPAPECPPGTPAGTAGCSPADTATGSQPETTTPVEGQTTVPSTSATGEPVRSAQDIVITGTRIPQPNLTSASPVTVLSSQEIKLQGTSRTEDLINSLPQSFSAQGSTVSNGATGTAEANLRGLGSARTLVLVNGRRLQPGDPRQPTSDLNFIPSALVKRVDVLTGGASSVYGADAVAGVVNFIMDTGFRGLRVDAQASTFWHNNHASDKIIGPNLDIGFRPPRGTSIDGGAQDISVAFGAGFDDNRGSVMAYATYRKQDSVLQADRDYSFCAMYALEVPDDSPFYCGGSTTSAEGRVRVFDPANPGNRLVNAHFDQATGRIVAGVPLFNYAPYNYYQRPDERYTLGAFAEYEISPGAKPYIEAMFMNDHSDAQIAPSGNFNNTTYLNCDNPLLNTAPGSGLGGLSMQQTICQPGFTQTGPINPVTGLPSQTAFVLIGRRNVEGGGRDDDLEHTSWRVVGGIRGDLLRGLSYDAYYQYGTTRLSETYLRDFSVARLQRAIDVVDADPGPGVIPVCRSVLNGTDPNCVPWNIFGSPLIPGDITDGTGVTQAALQYLQTPGFQRGSVNENIANANFTVEGGEYGVQTPWSDRGVALNVGGEYRKESLNFQVDEAFRTGDLAGQGGPTLPNDGSFDVREAFAEIQVPVVSNSFFDELTLTAGYRYSDYKVNNNHFNTDTYKLSAEFAPIRDVRLRASYNRAVRAPNIVELFGPEGLGLASGIDLCAAGTGSNGPAGTAFTTAQCLNTFSTQIANGNFTVATATAAINAGLDPNPAFQYNALLGGNANLQPETADTYTVGVVLQPRWVPGLAVTVDYFDIKVQDLVTTFPFTGLIASCAVTGNPTFCDLINRDVTGSLFNLGTGLVTLTNLNIGSLRTKGIDINASYSRRIGGMGTLNASLVGTYLKSLAFDTGLNPGVSGLDGKYECAGRYGLTCSNTVAGVPSPKWRHKFRLGFTMPNGLGISGQWRYYSSVKNDTLSDDADLNFVLGPHSTPGSAKLNSKSFFDLALTARLADRYNFRLGANNILDTDPPIAGNESLGGFSNGNTYPQVYDSMGRYVFAGVTIDF